MGQIYNYKALTKELIANLYIDYHDLISPEDHLKLN